MMHSDTLEQKQSKNVGLSFYLILNYMKTWMIETMSNTFERDLSLVLLNGWLATVDQKKIAS